MLAISDAVGGNRGDRDMAYDGLDRLTSATSPMFGTASYAYDVLDNLTHVTVTGGSQARDQGYVYDASNRLTNITSGGATVVGLGYDVQGNLANKNGVAYTFDYGNRLRGVGNLEGYRYDVAGRRVLGWSPTAGSILSVYGQDGVLRFQQNQRTATDLDYVYLAGSLVAIRANHYAAGVTAVTYQHTDALGSPVAVTDANRTVLQRSEYEPYGYLLNRPIEDGPGYTGHVSDAATGLINMQQRYYDPLIGQHFLSVDPVTAYGPGVTFNEYWYANANPFGLTDPDGRQARPTQGCRDQTCSEPIKPVEPNGCRTKRNCWQDAAGAWHITPPTRQQIDDSRQCYYGPCLTPEQLDRFDYRGSKHFLIGASVGPSAGALAALAAPEVGAGAALVSAAHKGREVAYAGCVAIACREMPQHIDDLMFRAEQQTAIREAWEGAAAEFSQWFKALFMAPK